MRLVGCFLVVAFFSLNSPLFALPKGKKEPDKAKTSQLSKPGPARLTPLVLDEDELRSSRAGSPSLAPLPRYLGPSQIEQSASPYVDVRVGIPETPGGNNHMRRQVALSPNGVVHMVYGIVNGFATAADSEINFFYFYNAYDCNGSGDLLIDPGDPNRLGLAMTAPGPPADPRPRYTNRGGLFIPPGTNTPVIYGMRYILRTETPYAGGLTPIY